jgi:hypothetical protein
MPSYQEKPTVEPDQVLADYRARVDGIAQRAQQTRQQIAAVRGTATSGDGAVTIAVNVQGGLEELTFGSAADSLSLPELASTILTTSRAARVRAAKAGAEALVPLIGNNSAAMEMVRANIPSDTSPDEVVGRSGRAGLNEEDDSGSVPGPLSGAAPTPQPRLRRLDEAFDADDADDAAGYTRGD